MTDHPDLPRLADAARVPAARRALLLRAAVRGVVGGVRRAMRPTAATPAAASVTRAATLCGLAVGVALAAADRAHARRAAAVDGALRAELPRAAAAESLHRRLLALDAAERAADTLLARRRDPLVALAALGERLPVSASITRVRAERGEWRVEGLAADPGAVAPALAGDGRFARVRALPAEVRAPIGLPARAPFAVSFRVRDVTPSPSPDAASAAGQGAR